MPETQNTTYPKNYLSTVLLRLDLPTLLSVQDGIKDFQSKIKDSFPILEPIEQKGLVVNANSEGQVQVEHPVKITWEFKSKDKTIECKVDEATLIVSTTKYTNYSDFKSTLNLVLNSFFEVYGAVVTKRIGFRYINEIKVSDEVNMAECINPWIYRDNSFLNEGHSKLRCMSKYELSLAGDNKMNFSFGIFNSKYPEQASENEFILDYDCYTQEPIEDVASILSRLDSYNQTMTDYFEKSVTDTFRTLLSTNA